ncbi:MAG TPA: VCBS repeat-containing protein [Bryobacteraceae bacterium]|jgi:hypothetical protein|nr:VCBS repeat-containing protein [Bryobacteraceae bacterium]
MLVPYLSSLGKGDGAFANPVGYSVGGTPFSLAVGDFNNDGNPDVAVAIRLSSTTSESNQMS